MKLLLDQKVSFRLVSALEMDYPGSAHVREFNLQEADDAVICVSKDADFHQRRFLLGHPPKFLWIRRGNCSTNDIREMLTGNVALVHRFHTDHEAAFLLLD